MTTDPDIFIDPPDTDNDPADIHWTIRGDVAGKMRGWSNYDVEDAVQAHLPESEEFWYDTEAGCFLGHTLSEVDAYRMVSIIRKVTALDLTVRINRGSVHVDLSRGYRRSDATHYTLLYALADALYAYPEQRLGQLLVNATRRDDGSQSDLWNKHDEEWIRALRSYAEEDAGT